MKSICPVRRPLSLLVTLLLLLIICLTSFSFADVDEFNTYRWNRKNELSGNGKIDNKPWFEWWYYKLVLPKLQKSFFFVYGVVNPWDTQKTLPGTRSYVGMGDFSNNTQVDKLFDLNDFSASYDTPYIEVGPNTASDQRVVGSVNEFGKNYSWDFEMEHVWTFNPEGRFIGKMLTNIEWYSAQADALCTGTITADGQTYEFFETPCYQDRNWGRSFPNWWAWIVSNQFENSPGTALSIGGGQPKIFNIITSPYEGVSIGLKHRGKEYLFSPFHLDWVKVDINFGKWEVLGINKTHKIKVSAWAPKDRFMDLQFMTPQGEVFHDYETLTGNLTVKLYKRSGILGLKWKLIDVLTSNYAGIEYGSKNDFQLDKMFTDKQQIYKSF